MTIFQIAKRSNIGQGAISSLVDRMIIPRALNKDGKWVIGGKDVKRVIARAKEIMQRREKV